jgi:hypothetical protein
LKGPRRIRNPQPIKKLAVKILPREKRPSYIKASDSDIATIMSSGSSQVTFTGLPLLPELRAKVFKHIFKSPTGFIKLNSWGEISVWEPLTAKWDNMTYKDNASFMSLGMLRTCRQFYNECKDILWKYNEVVMYWEDCECGSLNINPGSCTSESGRVYSLIAPLMRHLRLIVGSHDLNDKLVHCLASELKFLQSITLSMRLNPKDLPNGDLKFIYEHDELDHIGMMKLMEAKENEEEPDFDSPGPGPSELRP